jgi:hypothetical protein
MLMRIAAFLFALAMSGLAAAQSWPSRPVRMIVPFPAGGPTDVLTRALAEKLSAALGQAVVVDNKPGAGGTIGSDFVAKSAPDGYTLLMATGSTHSVGPYLSKVPYDPQKDFTPIIYVGKATNILLVSPTLGVSNVPRADRAREEEPGPAQLLDQRHRQRGASHQRDVRRDGRHQDRARALQGHAAFDSRPHVGPDRDAVRQRAHREAACRGRQAEGHRHLVA